MKTLELVLAVCISVCLASCGKQPNPEPNIDGLVFPSATSWQTVEPSSLGISNAELAEFKKYLVSSNTRAFLLLKNGRIVMEEYQNNDLLGKPFGQNSQWYWASAGKTLTSFTTGMAQEQGFLDISEKTSTYLGKGWTSLPSAKEDLITVKNQLTMSSGLDLSVADPSCFEPSCLQYAADAGTRWDYHNAPYTLLDQVIENATKKPFEDYFNAVLRDKIGMDGNWIWVKNDHVFFSTPRSMARFGILMANNGEWDGQTIMQDKSYFAQMTNTSQQLNKSYGYLWWLNGKESAMVPGIQVVFKRWLTPSAAADMVAAMGKNGQLLNIVPSKGLIVVRMGEFTESGQVGLDVQEEIWSRLNSMLD